MKQSKSIQSMIKNSMLWFKLCAIGVIFSFHRSLFDILIMKLSRMFNSQKKLNHRHGKWVSFLQEYSFVIRHKSGVENKAANALSRVVYILSSMAIQVVGFDLLKRDYNYCKDFSIIYDALAAGIAGAYQNFLLHDGYPLQRDPPLLT